MSKFSVFGLVLGFLVFVVSLIVGINTCTVNADGLSISPLKVNFSLYDTDKKVVKFTVSGYEGFLDISVEDLPFKFSPTRIYICGECDEKIRVTFYGDDSIASGIYEGKVRFLAVVNDKVGYGIKIPTTIDYTVTEEEGTTSGVKWQYIAPAIVVLIILLWYGFRTKPKEIKY